MEKTQKLRLKTSKSRVKKFKNTSFSAKKQKANIYIDGANMFYAQKHLGWFIDWKKIYKYLNYENDILEVRYYTGIKNNDQKMEKYLSYLRKIGFITNTKPLKVIKNKNNTLLYKSNCDIEIAVDLLMHVNMYKYAIILSGDSDFVYLVKILQKQFQKKVIIISSRQTMSWEMKLSADKYIFLEDIKKEVVR
ncbi:MAG: NYN domain-containing protein [bacterium]|nr:NYN domain-containing protein [bacterium]